MNGMKNVFLFIVIAVCQCSFCQQMSGNLTTIFTENNKEPYNVPTPTQSTLGSYGDFNMLLYAGKADVSIPVFKTSQRGVELDVSLSYDTSGLLINQLPGWIGHNWTLNAGGAISRKINGRPDELNFSGTNAGRDVFLCYQDACNNYHVMSNGRYKNFWEASDNVKDYEFIRGELLENDRTNVRTYDEFANYFKSSHNNCGLNHFVNTQYQDTSADVFYFNFMGMSGSFFFGNDGNWKVMSDQNIDILFDISDSTNYISSFEDTYWYDKSNCNDNKLIVYQPKTIKGFTLVDENGNKYFFGGDKTSIEYSMSLAGKCNVNTTEPWSAVSWMLKEVQDRFGNILYRFTYSRGNFIVQMHNSYSSITTISKDNLSLFPKHNSPKTYSGTINAPVYLDKISALDGTELYFSHVKAFNGNAKDILYPNISSTDIRDMLKATYKRLTYQDSDPYAPFYDPSLWYYVNFVCDSCSSYLDKMNIEKLKSIYIGSNTSKEKQICSFLYESKNRMLLNAILFGNDTQASHSYKFEYDRPDSLPFDYMTKQFDHWGYYNGIDYDRDSIKSTVLRTASTFDEYRIRSQSASKKARVSDIEYSTMGMLKKIIFPTGGYSILEYEQNTCSKYMSDDKQTCVDALHDVHVGGLRIKRISKYNKDVLAGSKTYKYIIPKTSHSSGELSSIPNTHYEFEDNSLICKVDLAYSIVPLSNSFIPVVGYSYITETDFDGSETTYKFTNFSTETDEAGSILRFNSTTPYNESSSRWYMRGKLLSETRIDNNGDTIQTRQHSYYHDEDYNKSNYVVTTSFMLHDILQNVGNVYKLFYFKPGIKKSITNTKFDNGWVEDSVLYDRKYKTLSITNTKGKTHNIDVFKTMSETISRKESQYKTEYIYPFLDSGANSLLVNQFCLPVTETKRYANGHLINGFKTIYGIMGQIVPKYDITYLANQNICDTIVKYVTYSSNYRIAEIRDRNNVSHSFYWNDDDRLIATLSNNKEQIQVYPDLKTMISSNHNVMFASKPIETNLYEYDPHGNLKTMVRHNCNYTKYTYDMFNRLNGVYDTNGNLTSSYMYHYAPKANVPTLYELNKSSIEARIDYTNNNKAIVVKYHLPYNFLEAEIKVQYRNTSNVIYSKTLEQSSTDGEIRINCESSIWGIIEIILYVNETKKESVVLSIPQYM